MTDGLLAGIEAGGTKFICAVARGRDDIIDRVRIDTTGPAETLGRCLEFFEKFDGIGAMGIASFGPLELRLDDARYGQITETPKPGWSGTDLVAPFVAALDVPISIDTDVNGAALAESRWGAATDVENCLYLTVGTGVGGGAVIDGRPVHGLVHPEMGHVSVDRLTGDEFPGICPFHGDCLEGLASGPAIEARWGARGESLDGIIEEVVRIEAATLASGLRQFVYVLAPQRIIIGGGVAKMPDLHAAVTTSLLETLHGYGVQTGHREGFVVPPGLGDDAGLAGAIALAQNAHRDG